MPELLNITIPDLLDQKAMEQPYVDAVVYPHEGLRYNYEEFRDICNKAARGMLAIGIKKGDHVAIWATNKFEWLVTQFATSKIGAVMVTVNTNYKKYELEYLLKQSDSTTLIMTEGFKDSNYINHIYSLCPQLKTSEKGKLCSENLPFLKNIIFIGENTPAGMYNFNELYELAENVSKEQLYSIQNSLDIHDTINMQYTSGTTGFPKGVMLTHHNLVNNGNTIAECMNFTNKDRLCIPVPLFHCFGCVLGVMAALNKGATMVMVDHFNPVTVMQAVTAEKCTALHGVPTMFIAILEHPDFKKYDFSSLRTGIMAGSPCPIRFMERAISEMNMTEITIAYGLTECSPVITQTRVDDPLELRVSTVGKAHPNLEVKIVDIETGKDLPPNQQGEIVSRGYQVMKGYYKMPEATAMVIDEEGWLHTGDLGIMDENGYFKVTGRLKDMIIRGGENIYPREIEEFLYTHPAVKDVQVIGVPDAKYGEEVFAYIILKDGYSATEQEIIEFVIDGLSRYKAPRFVRFIDSFPMTASGKIQKYKLREMATQELGREELLNIETV